MARAFYDAKELGFETLEQLREFREIQKLSQRELPGHFEYEKTLKKCLVLDPDGQHCLSPEQLREIKSRCEYEWNTTKFDDRTLEDIRREGRDPLREAYQVQETLLHVGPKQMDVGPKQMELLQQVQPLLQLVEQLRSSRGNFQCVQDIYDAEKLDLKPEQFGELRAIRELFEKEAGTLSNQFAYEKAFRKILENPWQLGRYGFFRLFEEMLRYGFSGLDEYDQHKKALDEYGEPLSDDIGELVMP
jgi:hypothetical protein